MGGAAAAEGATMEVDGCRSNPSPHELLEETRTAMEEIAAKMLFIKREGRPKSELRELITQMSLLFVTLRQANRAILLEEDRAKSETEAAKAPVDFTTLQLHNLMYEKNHYLKAIKACKDFRSKYPDILLVPEEEFLAAAPEDIRQRVLSADTGHDLMLKRLNYELFQRKELCKLREKLEQHKKALLETIATRKKFLSSLPSHLKSLKKASVPVQQQLGMPHSKKLKQHRAAELLPPPLYILYSQLLSQKEAFGERIELEILGSMKEAQAFAVQQSSKDRGITENTENSKLEDDTPDDDDDEQRRRKRPKKVASKDNLEHNGLYRSHPLNVILHIYDDEENVTNLLKLLTLRFEYLVKLNIVCVGIDGAEEGPESNILCNLFPDDTGTQLPHQRAKLYAGNSMVFDEKRSSRPFKWVQHLAGMDFLPELSPLLTCGGSSNNEMLNGSSILSGLSLYRHQNRVETLLQRIRSRRKARLALVLQLDSLTKSKWPLLTYENVPWALHTPACVMERFSLVGVVPDPGSAISVVTTEQAIPTLDLNSERRSETLRDEVESAREDGELPSAAQLSAAPLDLNLTPSKLSIDLEHSRSFSLIAKSVTPTKGKSSNLVKHENDMELILDSESDSDQEHPEPEKEEILNHEFVDNSWKDYAVREYQLVLNRTDKEKTLRLQAQIKISMEYPLRPPLFSLCLADDSSMTGPKSQTKDGVRWYNELRAMEAEVNLHILKILPFEHENYTLAHQVCCLAMLFDLHFNQLQTCSETMKSSSIVDVGLCKPITGKMIARSFRGRDRRKILSWKDMGCTQGYPY